MIDYEQLGVFYLGRSFDVTSGQASPQPILYDSKDLTTHAVIVGMTGSGKTGLGITLLEEAAIDQIPAIIIDPKGDLGNLMLTFPQLRAGDFQPWIESSEALRRGMTVEEFAAQQAQQWKEGLAAWDQPTDRISRFRDAAEVAIYTPGSDAGIPLTVLKSLDAPPPAIRENSESLRERTANAVSGLLTLLGLNADPLRSREHILLSNILETAWREGRDLDLAQLIREIQTPPFHKIGVMDLESIFPAADRRQLAMTINNVLASPAFASWTQGEPLDIQKLLYTKEGRPRLAILSISHLSEQERMFFVTIVLNEMISWMRSQPGTSSLRAILYMDELFGYLPPTANPPSKTPLLTLLKQARAYGLGLVLATQNPVDLDYKALSNAGTWFLGRLQAERDKLRVLDGLQGASEAAGVAFDRQKIETILSGLKNRVFLLNNVHEDHPIVFQCRWALSYLRGPLTREQIRTLTAPFKAAVQSVVTAARTAATVAANVVAAGVPGGAQPVAPILPPEIRQRHLPVGRGVSRDARLLYKPALLAVGRAHYVDAKSKVDSWKDIAWLVSISDDSVTKDPWDDGDPIPASIPNDPPPAEVHYAELPGECLRVTSYKGWATSFKNFLYRTQNLVLSYSPDLGIYSSPDDKDGAFRARLSHQAREARDLKMEKLRQQHEVTVSKLKEKIRKADQKVEVEKQQANSATMTAAMTFGSSVLGALFGRKKLSATNANRAATSMRAASRAAEQRGDIKRAEETRDQLEKELASLNEQLEEQLDQLKESLSETNIKVEPYEVKPRKSDLSVDEVALLWMPFVITESGRLEIGYEESLLQVKA
ncbi:helicase HerA domain-containing protein [Planctomicrobium sp. SH661]|uniref:helicase HerA domain-containing protein n=1 Tax=Planctomicrobium sp. SH661 TaxID=3448124 RepID=UPI003F5CAE7F